MAVIDLDQTTQACSRPECRASDEQPPRPGGRVAAIAERARADALHVAQLVQRDLDRMRARRSIEQVFVAAAVAAARESAQPLPTPRAQKSRREPAVRRRCLHVLGRQRERRAIKIARRAQAHAPPDDDGWSARFIGRTS